MTSYCNRSYYFGDVLRNDDQDCSVQLYHKVQRSFIRLSISCIDEFTLTGFIGAMSES